MDSPRAQVNFELQAFHPERFPLEIVIADEDNPQAERCTYAPTIVRAEDYPLDEAQSQAAWDAYQGNTSAASELTSGEATISYLDIADGDKEPPVYAVDLALVRYGRQVVRVYGPAGVASQQRLTVMAAANSSFDKLENALQLAERPTDADGFYTDNLFTFINAGEGAPRGRFYQQSDKPAGRCVYDLTINLYGQRFNKKYVLPGNLGQLSEQQVRRIGRRSSWHREPLTFNGDTEKTVHYWYTSGEVRVLYRTAFVDIDGEMLDSSDIPNNKERCPPGFTCAKILHPGEGYANPVFTAGKPCWGTLVVEYEAAYDEWALLYDFPVQQRFFEVSAGNVEQVGFETYDMEDNRVAAGSALDGVELSADQELDNGEGVLIPLKLFKKINFRPYKITPLTIIASNGKQAASTTWTPPAPDFSAIPEKELPRVAFFEKRRRERVYPDGGSSSTYYDVEHIEEVRYVDLLGNVTSEKQETREAPA